MASVFIASRATAENRERSFAYNEYQRLLRLAGRDRFKIHALTDDPHRADVIVFVGPLYPSMRDLRTHPLRRAYPDRCFVYHATEAAVPLLPGIYASISRRFVRSNWAVSGCFPRVTDNDNIVDCGPLDDCELLFSFAGALSNWPSRAGLARFAHPRGLVIDTSALSIGDRQRDQPRGPGDRYVADYLDLLRRSKFVLAPRGFGNSSWRLFETMKAGRVPVIVSDDWEASPGPDWASFSIRVPEARVADIPRLLEEAEPRAPEMARAARAAWEEWFAADVFFHRAVERFLAMRAAWTMPVWAYEMRYLPALLQPHFFRHWVLADLKRTVLGTV